MHLRRMAGLLSIIALPLMIIACGGGGGGGGSTNNNNNSGSADALQVADKVSVVDAKVSGSVAGSPSIRSFAKTPLHRTPSVPAGSDYDLDKANMYVQERSVEAFENVNNILCMIAQSQYGEMLNQGPYLALIDANKCSSNKSDPSAAGQASTNQSSGADAPVFEPWTMKSWRTDNSSPEYVQAWIHEKAHDAYDMDKVILATVTVTEGKTDSNPLGIFTVNYKGLAAADTSQVIFKGTLKSERDEASGKILLKFAEEEGPAASPTRKQYATLDKATDGSDAGSGKVYQYDTQNGGSPETVAFNIAFNTNYFLRSDAVGTSPDICLNRNVFDMSAWQYGLYDATTGARVVRNSSYQIKVGTAYGNIGYWGMWLPDGVSVASGDTVMKHDYQNNTDTPYTVFKSNGKLKRHTRQALTLADVKNIPLNYSICSGTCSNYQVVWNGSALMMTAQQSQSDYTWQTITPAALDLSALSWNNLNFWSDSLGGQVSMQLTGCTGTGPFDCTGTVANTTPIIFYAEDIVYPDDTTLGSTVTFSCFDNCPNAGASGINTSTPFLTYTQNGYTYVFSKAAMMLTYNGNNVVQTAAISGSDWGVMSGALFDPLATNETGTTYQDLLKCDWDQNQTCGWKAWSVLPVFYTWETGLNDYNKFVALKDGNNAFVKFDPPLQVEYVHSQPSVTAYDHKYDGTKFYLNYDGAGQLNGIPGKCVDDGGTKVSCSNNTRWVPEFMIQAGSAATAGSDTYLIKPLGIEERMMEDTNGGCDSLSIGSYTLPTLSQWVDPSAGSNPVTVANEPVITVAPAVVGGIVQ